MAGDRSILKNTFTVGAFTALSRVMGLVREMFQARLVGAGVEQSAFTLAFAIPNMARKLFGEGALTAAFVPVFKGEVETAGVEKAARLARSVATMMMLVLGAAVALALAGVLGAAAGADALGFSPRTRLTLSLVAILLPYMLAICGAAFGMGVLNALGRFMASSVMPCLLNGVWIAVLVALCYVPCESPAARIRMVSAAILVGGFVQFAYMLAVVRRAGVALVPSFRGWGDGKVRLVWRNMGIAAFGAGAIQVNYMLDQVLAQVASPWAAGVVGYAERLMDLPLGVVGVAFGTVLLPTFSGLFAKGDVEGARAAMASSVKSLMFVMAPAAAGLFVLAPEMTRVIYEGRAFDPVATVRVSRAVAVYAVGLGFFGLQKSLVPWFQAQNDMKTPLRVSVATVCLNAALNVAAVFLLPVEWRHVGLAASTVLCAAVGCALLAALARRRNGRTGLAQCAAPVARMAVAAVAMGGAVWTLRPVAARAFASCGARAGSVLSLGALVASGMLVYGAIAAVFMPDAARALVRRFRRRGRGMRIQ